ncbi:MAG: glycosyltransferase family 4 protein [Thermoproteales archaeon]|nr:glycosyltransferase family 4 protein [Thermoproteales archaeon]
MKILHLVNEGLVGGVLRVAYEQAIHLEKLGHESIVVEGYRLPTFQGFPKAKSCCKLRFGSRFSSSTPIKILARPLAQLWPLRLPNGYMPDWVICHNFGLIRDALKLKRNSGSKLAVMLHNATFPSMFSDYMISKLGLRSSMAEKARRILANCDAVLTTSRNMQRMVRELYGVGSQVIYPGCRPLPEVPAKRGGFILCASRLSLGKRVDIVARIVSVVGDDVEVVFAGSTHETTRMAVKKIKDTGIKNYKIIPNIGEDELRRLYMQCRLFISVSGEPFGMNQLEAASHGAPMVCNAASGASELFKNGVHGYFIRHDSPVIPIEKYADKIRKLIENERLAWKMGYNAWRLCCERYTWDHHVKELVKVLESHG